MDGETTFEVTNLDKNPPFNLLNGFIDGHMNVSVAENEVNYSGVVGYQITTQDIMPANFINVAPTKSLNLTVYGYTYGQTYYLWSIDAAGNVGKCSVHWWS